jgi:hypothetical protein
VTVLSETLRSLPTADTMGVSQSKQLNGGFSRMSVTIRVRPRTLSVTLLWLTAVASIAWNMADGAAGAPVGRAGLLVGMGATTWTIILAMKHCRRVILEVMSYEHRLQMLREDPDGEHRATVRAIH